MNYLEFQPGVPGLQNVCLPVSHGGWTVASWDSWTLSTRNYDLFLFNGAMDRLISYSARVQSSDVAGTPLESIYGAPVSDACLVVALSSTSSNITTSTIPTNLIHINTIRGSVNQGLAVITSSISTPADATGATTVGAVRHSDNIIESFSSAGPTDDGRPKPEICAFDGVSSTQDRFNPFYGTSAAAPHVAGAAALVLQTYSSNNNVNTTSATTQQTIDKIMSTAVVTASSNHGDLCGAGILSLQHVFNQVSTNGINFTDTSRTSTGNINNITSNDNNNRNDSDTPIVAVGSDSITIQSITTLPAHGTAQIVSDNTQIQYTPNLHYNGADTMIYRITDDSGLTDTATVSINVTPVNDAPLITPIPDYEATPGQLLSFNVTATDPDDSDVLTFSLSGTAAPITDAVIHESTGRFVWTPTGLQANTTVLVDITVTDNGVPPLSDSYRVNINVTSITAPTFTQIPDTIFADRGYIQPINITSSNPNGGPLVFTVSPLANFMNLTQENNSAMLAISPSIVETFETHSITVTVTDSLQASTSHEILIIIQNKKLLSNRTYIVISDFSVAVYNDTAVITESDLNDSNNMSGAVYIYTQNDDGTWTQTQKITRLDDDSNNVISLVAIYNDTMLVGAREK